MSLPSIMRFRTNAAPAALQLGHPCSSLSGRALPMIRHKAIQLEHYCCCCYCCVPPGSLPSICLARLLQQDSNSLGARMVTPTAAKPSAVAVDPAGATDNSNRAAVTPHASSAQVRRWAELVWQKGSKGPCACHDVQQGLLLADMTNCIDQLWPNSTTKPTCILHTCITPFHV